MKDKLTNTLVVLFSLILIFSLLEIITRVYWREFRFVNFLDDYLRLDVTEHPIEYDGYLGWTNKPGISIQQNKGNQITILENGMRSNGTAVKSSINFQQAPILVVGDSFTYGYDVSDNETWPAILESMLGRHVINGGVPAYGIDQIYLRAKMLINEFNPAVLIFSFIPEDILRAQLSVKGGIAKPYFTVEDGELSLRNVPVPKPSLHDHGESGVRSMLGYSLLLHKIMMRPGFVNWWVRGDKWIDKQSDSLGDEVSCLILRELEKLKELTNMEIIILVQYGIKPPPGHLKLKAAVLQCVNEEAIEVLDLRSALQAEKQRSPATYYSYFAGHMTYEGNMFVAKQIRDLLLKSRRIVVKTTDK